MTNWSCPNTVRRHVEEETTELAEAWNRLIICDSQQLDVIYMGPARIHAAPHSPTIPIVRKAIHGKDN